MEMTYMGQLLRKVPWGQLVVTTLLAVLFYAYTLDVKATIHEELRGYVTRAEFDAWVDAHKQWSEAELKRIDGNFTDLKELGRDNNTMLRQLLQRRPPVDR